MYISQTGHIRIRMLIIIALICCSIRLSKFGRTNLLLLKKPMDSYNDIPNLNNWPANFQPLFEY